ncbi:MAG TPA: TMEM175 family protein [Gemmatimonadaceae bacterium]|nr:TMEM175 family protein [Gemmatimonadaceae bacterium]
MTGRPVSSTTDAERERMGNQADRLALSETSRIEAFSDGVFAIAITLLILEIQVPHADGAERLTAALAHLWPSYLAFLASFMTIGVMWMNHHRLFTLIERSDGGLMALNLLLLLGQTWIPFPTALLAEHLRGRDMRVAGIVYAASFFVISIVFNVLWRYAVRMKLVADDINVDLITKQYTLGPIMYGLLVVVAIYSATWVLILSALYALYFALPPRIWGRK